MIERLDRELRQAHLEARLACSEPIKGSDLAYEVGRRIGVAAGLAKAIGILSSVVKDRGEKDHLL